MIKQIELPLRGRQILFITRMTTDRIGLHSVLLPLLIHDTRLLCTRFRTAGIKAMSRGFSGGKQVIKSADTRNRGRVCLF